MKKHFLPRGKKPGAVAGRRLVSGALCAALLCSGVEGTAAAAEGGLLRSVFQGVVTEYQFEPASVVRVRLRYQYSSTGGLAGIDAASPEVLELEAQPEGDSYVLELSLPEVEGFRIVLDPGPLNAYLVSPPTGDETPEELQAKLEHGDFDVNTDNDDMPVYYYQEYPDGTLNPAYGNRYSDGYNHAWNAARTVTVEGEDGYTATAYCGSEEHLGHEIGNHGANALQSPRLKVTLSQKQLTNALEHGLDITVSYRRNATWYTVEHWVPPELSGLSEEKIAEKKAKGEVRENDNGEVTYVLLDTDRAQGRVGALTRAAMKTGGVYDLLVPLPFSQQLIVNELETNSSLGTVVPIYYEAAKSYRIIFDTDYTYIPRQQVDLGDPVDFQDMAEPQRKGYTFAGWQYLNKDALPDGNGEYSPGDYTPLSKDADGVYQLTIDEELIFSKAKLKETGGVQALHLYPIWEADTTQVTVVLWTEDLDGLTDVQATVEGEAENGHYHTKYAAFSDEVTSTVPALGATGSNTNFSNAGSFTMTVTTGSELTGEPQGDEPTLQEKIQAEVDENFMAEAKDVDAVDASQFYTQCGFEILHDSSGEIDYSTTTANADGRTMIYVYFTRNIYTLKFHYYGEVGGATQVAANTNGYSWGGPENILTDDGDLNFGYSGGGTVVGDTTGKTWGNERWTVDPQTVSGIVPRTITITAKYGADLREVWPVARGEEAIPSRCQVVSWATTAGKYRDEALDPTSSHYYEATLMGLYAAMDSYIIADPAKPEQPHHLVAYWGGKFKGGVSYYRYTHCYELPGLTGMALETDPDIKTVQLYEDETAPDNASNKLYLVPAEKSKFGFSDLLHVSYDKETGAVTYDVPDGPYYAVREYTTVENGERVTRYYAVARQITTVSDNAINMQNPSARTHMTRANATADHTTEHGDDAGRVWNDTDTPVGTQDDPYDLYFYYDRDRYTIRYMAPKAGTEDGENEVELGRIELPYGARVTQEVYGFRLNYRDTNLAMEDESTYKYLWSVPKDNDEYIVVPVCPDRNPDGAAAWTFKG